jgi:hypothetical protein
MLMRLAASIAVVGSHPMTDYGPGERIAGRQGRGAHDCDWRKKLHQDRQHHDGNESPQPFAH